MFFSVTWECNSYEGDSYEGEEVWGFRVGERGRGLRAGGIDLDAGIVGVVSEFGRIDLDVGIGVVLPSGGEIALYARVGVGFRAGWIGVMARGCRMKQR